MLHAEYYKRRAGIVRTLESEVSSTENLHVVWHSLSLQAWLVALKQAMWPAYIQGVIKKS